MPISISFRGVTVRRAWRSPLTTSRSTRKRSSRSKDAGRERASHYDPRPVHHRGHGARRGLPDRARKFPLIPDRWPRRSGAEVALAGRPRIVGAVEETVKRLRAITPLQVKDLAEQIGYSQKVMEHFMNPHNVGVIENPDGYGKVGNPVCGDIMEIFIRVEDDVIKDIRFRTFGCGSAIATSSMVTNLAKGKTLDEAIEITRDDVATELEGLPPRKMHCSNLAADALHAAIEDYREKQKNG